MVRAGWTFHGTRRVRTQGKTKGLPTRPKGRWNARCVLRWKTPTESARRDGWFAKVGPELLRRRAFYEGCGHPRRGRHSRCAPGTYVYLAECMYAPRNLHKRRPNPLRLKRLIHVVASVGGVPAALRFTTSGAASGRPVAHCWVPFFQNSAESFRGIGRCALLGRSVDPGKRRTSGRIRGSCKHAIGNSHVHIETSTTRALGRSVDHGKRRTSGRIRGSCRLDPP